MAGEEIEDADLFGKLPEECIEEVVSLIGPMEACRLSVVCKRFLSAAESSTVWDRYLPSDNQQFLDRADSLPNIKFDGLSQIHPDSNLLSCSDALSDSSSRLPVLTESQCFWLHKRSGKKCFLVAASFTGGVEEYFLNPGWCTRSEKSRFQNQITECHNLLLFEIRGKISTCMLSPDTTYAIYLVFHSPIIDEYFNEPVEVSIGIDGVESIKQNVCLNPHKMRSEGDDDLQYPQQRKDDRFEIRLGEYFNRGGEEMNLEITMTKNSEIPKTGPGVEGFEFRPKGS